MNGARPITLPDILRAYTGSGARIDSLKRQHEVLLQDDKVDFRFALQCMQDDAAQLMSYLTVLMAVSETKLESPYA